MDRNRSNRKHITQKKYRRSQINKGLVRFEIQVNAATKKRFDQLVATVADEMAQPWDPRRRQALARTHVFGEITQGITHEFFALKDQINALKAEIKALSPTFFKTNATDSTPLPEAIRTLPDDPHHLKMLLATTYQDAQQAHKDVSKYKRLAHQYEELYEVTTRYNDELKGRLNEQGVV